MPPLTTVGAGASPVVAGSCLSPRVTLASKGGGTLNVRASELVNGLQIRLRPRKDNCSPSLLSINLPPLR